MEHLEHPLSTSPTRPNEWNEMQISLPNEAPLRPNGSTCLMNEVERFRSGSELKPAEKKPTLSFWENDKESITFFELFFRQIRRRTPCPTWSLLYSVNHLECPRSLLVLAGSLRSFSFFLSVSGTFPFSFFFTEPTSSVPSFLSFLFRYGSLTREDMASHLSSLSQVFYWNFFFPTGSPGFYVFYKVLRDFTSLETGFYDFVTFLLGFTGFYSVLLGFTGFYWVWLGLTGFDWVWLGLTGFYWVLLGLTGFGWVWLGFTGFLLGLTGFDWVWLGLTGFYWVLMGFTGFYRVFLSDYWVFVNRKRRRHRLR